MFCGVSDIWVYVSHSGLKPPMCWMTGYILPVKWREVLVCPHLRLVDRGMQRRAGRDVFLQTAAIAPLRARARLLVIQTPKTIVILVTVALLAAAPLSPAALLLLDLGAVEDVDGVGRQGELQAAEVLVHHLFAVDELAAVDLGKMK